MKNTDLHTHSHYSDGQSSPKEIVKLAKRRRIKNLALTDHNSVKGVKEAVQEGKKINVNIIPGVEVGTNYGEVLGYFININNKELIKKLNQNSKKIENRVKGWCQKINKVGYNISLKELQKKYPKAKDNINEFHILYTLYVKKYGKPLEIAKKLFDNKKLRPKKIRLMKTITAIKAIRKAGGVPVLAHPWIGQGKKDIKNIKKLVKAGLKGIEINNGDRPPLRDGKLIKKIKILSKKHSLILTSGSDYHGKQVVRLMPGNHEIGKNNCDEKVAEKLRKLSKDF